MFGERHICDAQLFFRLAVGGIEHPLTVLYHATGGRIQIARIEAFASGTTLNQNIASPSYTTI